MGEVIGWGFTSFGPTPVEAQEAGLDGFDLAEDLGSRDLEHGGLISDGLELSEEPYANISPLKSLRCNVQAKRVLSSSPPLIVEEEGVDGQVMAWGSAG